MPYVNRPIKDLFRIPGARTADTSFSTRDDGWFDGVTVLEYDIAPSGDTAALSMTLTFGADCPLRRRYARFMPQAGAPVVFTGEIEPPFDDLKQLAFSVTGRFVPRIELPFARMLPPSEAFLTIDNHVFDSMDMRNYPLDPEREQIYTTLVLWTAVVELSAAGLQPLRLSYNLLSHAQRFVLQADFDGDGLSVADIMGLFAALAGKTERLEIPDWLIVKNVALRGVSFLMGKDISEIAVWPETGENAGGFLDGVAAAVGLRLPKLPVPFLGAEAEKGADITLHLSWDALALGGQLSAVIVFQSKWKDYAFVFNIELPALYLEARLIKEENALASAGNSVFPGFFGLSPEEIRVYGSLRENSYGLSFSLVNTAGQSLPFVPGRFFLIDNAYGEALYTPEGYQLRIGFRFTLLSHLHIVVEGRYEKRTGGGSLISLAGGLYQPVSLIGLVNELLGTSLSKAAFDLEITRLYMTYSTALDDGASDLSAGRDRHFTFLCAVKFHWDIVSLDVDTFFSLDWTEAATALSLGATVSLLGFTAEASCDIAMRGEDASLTNYRFALTLRDMRLIAEQVAVDDHHAIRITLESFNLGTLLEALIGVIARDASWYLPWPFRILKQVTLSKLTVTFDETGGTIEAEYSLNLKILFFELRAIKLLYNRNTGEFLLDLGLSGVEAEGVSQNDSGLFPYGMDLLRNKFDLLPLGSPLLELRYLGVGQHIRVDLPPVTSENAVTEAIAAIRAQIKRDGAPTLDGSRNWLAVLELTLLDSIDISLLMCDPVFYGALIRVTGDSSATKAFKGLSLLILYRKVTETVGVYQIKLTLPERYRNLELGAASVRIGEMELAIYTNGNFMIDLGFPHGGDFSRSFGLAFGIFSGLGGFYFGVLNGETSSKTPGVTRGRFGAVVELGLGIQAGIGREIKKGPLRAGAYVRILAIFEGVFSVYKPPEESGPDASYYLIQATAGLVAEIYGEVDFALIKVGFSVRLSLSVTLRLESYRQSLITVSIAVSVSAYIKILFIKISFSFSFTWNDSFTIGENSPAPWDRYLQGGPVPLPRARERIFLPVPVWDNGPVFDKPKTLFAELSPLFSADGVSLGEGAGQPAYKIAFIPCLHGYQDETLRYLGYADATFDTPLPILLRAFLTRAFRSYAIGESIGFEELKALLEEISKPEALDGGFSMAALNEFFTSNFRFDIGTVTALSGFEGELHGVPMPMPPCVTVSWRTGSGDPETYGLSADPMIPGGFFDGLNDYFGDLSLGGRKDGFDLLRQDTRSAGTALFCDYWLMLTRLALTKACDRMEDDGNTFMRTEELIELVTAQSLDDITGQVSRYLLGSLRAPDADGSLGSLYSFAHQQFDGAAPGGDPGETAHVFTVTLREMTGWLTLSDKELRVYRRGVRDDLILRRGGAVRELRIPLRYDELLYPEPVLRVDVKPALLPYFVHRNVLVELKNPLTLETRTPEEQTLFEAASPLPEGFTVRLYEDGGGRDAGFGFEPVCRVGVPLTRLEGSYYAVGPMSPADLNMLREAPRGGEAELRFYRAATAFDDAGKELLPVAAEGVFLRRQNLSLESEKPELRTRSQAEQPLDSAYAATQPGVFLALLRDAGLVNARGYYLTCELPGYAVEDGAARLTVLIAGAGAANAVLLSGHIDPAVQKPVAETEEECAVSAFPVGRAAFLLETDEPAVADVTGRLFSMLTYRIEADGALVRASHESLPVMPESHEGKRRFSQSVPFSRFIEGEDPYRGVQERVLMRFKFAFLDPLGNKTAEGLSLTSRYGYTDPLLPVSAYPHTAADYTIARNDGGLTLTVRFSYAKKEEEPFGRDGLLTAYWQLHQPDVTLSVTAQGERYPLSAAQKDELVAFIGAVIRTERAETPPAPVELRIAVTLRESVRDPIAASVTVARSPALAADSLRNDPLCSQVYLASSPLAWRSDPVPELGVGKDESGGVYLLPPLRPVLERPSFWAIPPLATHLISLTDIEVEEIDGGSSAASFTDIDLEVWIGQFLGDFEGFLSPGSVYADDQAVLERLTALKRLLADRIAASVTHVTRDDPDARQKAADAFREHMLRNLADGRGLSALAVIRCGGVDAAGFSALCRAETDREIAVSAGKIGADGFLTAAFRTRDISRQKEMELALTLTLTDCEVFRDGKYRYIAPDAPPSAGIKLRVPLPYSRYPDAARLISQHMRGMWEPEEELGASGAEEMFLWEYSVCLSHETAAQDVLDMEPVFGARETRGMGLNRLAEALAGYIHIREALRGGGEAAARALIKAAERVAEGLAAHRGYPLTRAGGTRFVFAADPARGKLVTQPESSVSPPPGIALLLADGRYESLPYDPADRSYSLPEGYEEKRFTYRVSFARLDIREQNIVNTRVTVSRNASIEGINPAFVYRTPQSVFPNALRPSLRYTPVVSCGSWTRENFAAVMQRLGAGFGRAAAEITCGRKMSVRGEKTLYAFLPVLYAPRLAASDPVSLEEVFRAVEGWRSAHLSAAAQMGSVIELHAAFFDERDDAYNLAELSHLRFYSYSL